MSGTAWMARQLIRVSVTADRPATRRPANPCPAGQIQEGSTTWFVLAMLWSAPDRLWTAGQLVRAIQAFDPTISGRTVSWSLCHLQHRGYLRTFNDPRNPRYLRYSAAK